MSEQETATPQPKEVIRERVSAVEVGKYYLKAEFGRIFPEDLVRESLDQRIEGLAELEFWRLLEATSDTFRINGVFRLVGEEGNIWNEELWDPQKLTLAAMNPDIDRVTHLPEIGQDPARFVNYLSSYFADHPDDDPEHLNQFRKDDRVIRYERVLLREEGGKISMLDGSNRLIKMLFEGKKEVTAFIARKTNESGRYRLGDSTFVFLRTLYYSASEEERVVLFKLIKRVMEETLNGRGSIQNYWVDHIEDKRLKQLGLDLLKERP